MFGSKEVKDHMVALAKIMRYECKDKDALLYLEVAVKETEVGNMDIAFDLMGKAERIERENARQ